MEKFLNILDYYFKSKWGSWAYDLKERDRQGKTKLEDFKKWRREIMEDIYNDYINQNKDE